ncbi:MAG: putative exported carboxypeptidase [Herbinix sp.]|jgi:hypothetical protein|nr:putative exported carboxypeptidase [Herbinix sp.]
MRTIRSIAIAMSIVIVTDITTLDTLYQSVRAEESDGSTSSTTFAPQIASEPIVSPIPTIITTVSPTSKPTPTPFVTDTLASMAEYDYVKNSVTDLSSEALTIKTLPSNVSKYGTLYGRGMPYAEYKAAMEYKWTDCTDYITKFTEVSINLKNTMNYNTYVNTLTKLSRYDGVYLYTIGKSTEGRNIYAIEIDIESSKDKEVFMFTGQVHAREFAGGTFLMKMLADLLSKAQNNKETMELLKSYKYVAVPIINVDGREALIKEPSKWSPGGSLWKAYINGTDGNRNFPSVVWGQVSEGNNLKWSVKTKPSADNYPGKYAGSNSETKAMMKWLYHYIVVEKALCLLDMHQQGSKIYAGKEWSTQAQERIANNLRKCVFKVLNKGNYSRTYGIIEDEPVDGFDGSGSSITDYAVSLATGAKFSPTMGFCAYTDGEKEYILMQITDLDNIDFDLSAANKNFSTLTVEIGFGSKYLGNSTSARKLLATEYTKYHFDKLFERLPGMY